MEESTELAELKASINKSFKELVRLYLGVKNTVEDIEERLVAYNKGASHKI